MLKSIVKFFLAALGTACILGPIMILLVAVFAEPPNRAMANKHNVTAEPVKSTFKE